MGESRVSAAASNPRSWKRTESGETESPIAAVRITTSESQGWDERAGEKDTEFAWERVVRRSLEIERHPCSWIAYKLLRGMEGAMNAESSEKWVWLRRVIWPVSFATSIPEMIRRQRALIVTGLAGLLVFVVLSRHFRGEQARALRELNELMTPAGGVRPAIDVREALRSMKLVTTELHADVATTCESKMWRGDASATVVAPAVYHYGVDLSEAGVWNLGAGVLPDAFVVSLPPPARIAVEVDIDRRTEEVRVTGTRLKSRSGQYLLGKARVEVVSEARRSVLSPEQATQVRAEASRRVEELVHRIAGESARVFVRFEERGGS